MTNEPRWNTQELKAELIRYEDELRADGKARNTINTYVQHPERFIKWLERRYGPKKSDPLWTPDLTAGDDNRGGFDDGRESGRSSRYDPLKKHLAERSDPVIRLSFAQIEQIIDAELPASAYRHRPWWANERSGSHVHARSWMDAGRRTANVDMNATTVDFVR